MSYNIKKFSLSSSIGYHIKLLSDNYFLIPFENKYVFSSYKYLFNTVLSFLIDECLLVKMLEYKVREWKVSWMNECTFSFRLRRNLPQNPYRLRIIQSQGDKLRVSEQWLLLCQKTKKKSFHVDPTNKGSQPSIIAHMLTTFLMVPPPKAKKEIVCHSRKMV